MKHLSIAGLVFILCATQAFAAAYDDFARGLAANNRDDSDTAIIAFTAALTAGDLSSTLQPAAHFGRAVALVRKRRCGEAVADLDAALAAKPGYPEAQLLRGSANSCAGNYDIALKDYDALIASQPTISAHIGRAWVQWRKGSFADAAADFAEAAKLGPRLSYPVVWIAMAETRAGTLDLEQVEDAMSRVSDSEWPGPMVSLYLGRLKPDEVPAAVARGDQKELSHRQCEADFYLAEWWLAHDNPSTAKTLLDSAIATCPNTFLEYDTAKVERDRMK